jgi:membrane fusion protein, heavy metal efflux system
MKALFCYAILSLAAASLTGCNKRKVAAETPQPDISHNQVTIETNSPQLSALRVEPVSTVKPAPTPLAGRLIWDENATVRVFSPFAGIVRKLFVGVNQAATKGQPLAEIQSAEFGQAQAEARKAQSEFRRAQRNLDRLRDLFEYGAAPRKDLDSAEADFASARAERERAEARLCYL